MRHRRRNSAGNRPLPGFVQHGAMKGVRRCQTIRSFRHHGSSCPDCRLLLTPARLFAQQAATSDQAQASTGQPPKRVRNVTLTGDQKCPESTAEEVVVCGRDDEPYRIPRRCATTSRSRAEPELGQSCRDDRPGRSRRGRYPRTPARRLVRAVRADAASCGTSNTRPTAVRVVPKATPPAADGE